MATLWLIVALGAVSLALAVMARRTLDGSRNRINERVAYWRAIGCLARGEAALNDQLASQPGMTREQAAAVLPAIDGCKLSLPPSTTTVDINSLTATQARALAVAAGLSEPQEDSAVRAISSAQLRRFTSDSAIAGRDRTFLRRSRLLRFLTVDSVTPDVMRAPREVRAVLLLANDAPVGVNVSTAARAPPADSTSPSEWWIVACARDGDPPAAVTVRMQIVSFGGSLGVKEYRVE